jgi:hypothetical protein
MNDLPKYWNCRCSLNGVVITNVTKENFYSILFKNKFPKNWSETYIVLNEVNLN